MQWTDESIAFLRDAAAMNRYYETIAEKITPQLQENAHVCDAGCGIGELSLALKPYCRHVTAVDADALAIKTLKAHLIEGVTARCGDMETLAPEKPYDAMVFCLFGRTQDTLRIAKKQCRGRIFLVKRDYLHHRFSAGKVSLGEYTAESTEAVLHEKGVHTRWSASRRSSDSRSARSRRRSAFLHSTTAAKARYSRKMKSERA